MTSATLGRPDPHDGAESLFHDGHLDAFGLFSYAEGLLSTDEETQARGHLAGCARCRQAVAAEQTLTVSLRRVDLPAPVGMAERVRHAILVRRRQARSYRLWWAAAVTLLLASGLQWLLAGVPPGSLVTSLVSGLVWLPQGLVELGRSVTDGSLLEAIADGAAGVATVVSASPVTLGAVSASLLLVAAAVNLVLLYSARRLLVEVRR